MLALELAPPKTFFNGSTSWSGATPFLSSAEQSYLVPRVAFLQPLLVLPAAAPLELARVAELNSAMNGPNSNQRGKHSRLSPNKEIVRSSFSRGSIKFNGGSDRRNLGRTRMPDDGFAWIHVGGGGVAGTAKLNCWRTVSPLDVDGVVEVELVVPTAITITDTAMLSPKVGVATRKETFMTPPALKVVVPLLLVELLLLVDDALEKAPEGKELRSAKDMLRTSKIWFEATTVVETICG